MAFNNVCANNYKIKNKTMILNYEVLGNKSNTAIILIHGFNEDVWVWNKIKNDLQKRFFLIIPKLNEIEVFADSNNNLLEEYALAVKSIIDKLEIKKCYVIGHSMGGYIALNFVNNFPNFLLGLGLINSNPYADDIEKINARKKSIAFLEAHPVSEFCKTSIPNLYNTNFGVSNKEEIAFHINYSSLIHKSILIAQLNAMMNRQDSTGILKNLNVPLLVLIGKNDPIISLEKSIAYCTISNITQFDILENSAHMSMVEDFEIFTKISKFTTILS